MHVENVAIYDASFNTSTLRDKLVATSNKIEAESGTVEKLSATARENLIQVAAVAGICNAAAFSAPASTEEKGSSEIIGDATGIRPSNLFSLRI